MRRRIVSIAAIVSALLAVLLGSAVVWLANKDLNAYRNRITQAISAAIGRQVDVRGDLKVALSLIPTVSVHSVAIGNAAWAQRQTMASVETLSAQMEILPMLFGEVRIGRIVLEDVDIELEKGRNGQRNWIFKPAEAKASTDGVPFKIDVKEVLVRNLKLSYQDIEKKSQNLLEVDRASATSNDFDGEIAIETTGRINGERFQAKGNVGSLTTYRATGRLSVHLKATIMDADISVDASISDRPNGYRVSDLKLKFDSSDVSGDATIEFQGEQPRIEARLLSEFIDVASLLAIFRPPASHAAKVDGKSDDDVRVFPDDPIPLHYLDMAAVSMEWRVARAKLPAWPEIGNLRVTLVNGKKGLEIKPIHAEFAGGAMNGSIGLMKKQQLPVVNLDVKAENIDLGSLLTSLGYKDILTGGKTRMAARFDGSGASIRTLMAGLNGSLTTEIGEGRIHNQAAKLFTHDVVSQIFSEINVFAEKTQGDQLRCAVVRAVTHNGQLQIPDSIALDTGTVSMTASGAIDLKTEALDIAFRTDPKKGLKFSTGQEIAKLFRLRGTLGSPSLGVDLTGAAGSAIRWGGAVATAGISLLAERLYKETTKVQDVCQHALTKAPVAGNQDALQQLTDQPVRSIVKGTGTAVEKTVKGTGSVIKDTGKTIGTGVENIGKGINRGLKSLFGTPKSD